MSNKIREHKGAAEVHEMTMRLVGPTPPDPLGVMQAQLAAMEKRLASAERTIIKIGPCKSAPHGNYGHAWSKVGEADVCGYCNTKVEP